MGRITRSSGKDKASESSDKKSKQLKRGSEVNRGDKRSKDKPAGMKDTVRGSKSNNQNPPKPKKKAASSTPISSLGELRVDLLKPKEVTKNTLKSKNDSTKNESKIENLNPNI